MQNYCEDHVKSEKTRIKFDYRDFKAFYLWLNSRNPFLVVEDENPPLSTGLFFIRDDVPCTRADEIGPAIQ